MVVRVAGTHMQGIAMDTITPMNTAIIAIEPVVVKARYQ
jgi:hypothetical protein